jgi:hypothetical protein
MLQLSIIFSRIASTSRAIAFDTTSISSSKRCVTTAWVKATNNGNDDDYVPKQRHPIQPEVRYRSRLAELYDDMFEQAATDSSSQSQTISPQQSKNDKNAAPPMASTSSSQDYDPTTDLNQLSQEPVKDSKWTPRSFVKPQMSIPKALSQGRKFKTFEYDSDEIGDYMTYMQSDLDNDIRTSKEDKEVLTSFEEYPMLESFPDSSPQKPQITSQPPPQSVPNPRAQYVQKTEKPSVNTTGVSRDDDTIPVSTRTANPIESDSVSSEAVTRSVRTTLQAGSRGMAEPYSTLTLKSQIRHIESEVAKFNGGVNINLNSRKQLSMLLFGVPDESTSKDVLEGIAGNIANTDGRAKIASLVLQYRKFIKDLNRIESQNNSKVDGTFIASVHSKDQVTPSDQRLQANSIVASNGDHREPLVLIDASAYIFRSYYAMPPMHRYDGEPVGMYSKGLIVITTFQLRLS